MQGSTDAYMAFLDEYTSSNKGPGLAGLQNALYMAATLSSVCLFLPHCLSKQHLNKKTTIEVRWLIQYAFCR